MLCQMGTRCSHLEQDNTMIYLDKNRIYRYIPYYTIIVSVAKKKSLISEIKCITYLENTRFKIQT